MQQELEQILKRNIIVGINHISGRGGVTAVDWQKLISELEQLFHKPPCSTLRGHLDMMLNKEHEAKSYAIDDDTYDEHDRYINAIQRVQVLIDEVYPVA